MLTRPVRGTTKKLRFWVAPLAALVEKSKIIEAPKRRVFLSGYIINHYNILDRSRINELGPLYAPLLEKYKGEVAVGDYVIPLEGKPYSHFVAYRFHSQAEALEFYNSVEHQEISKVRKEITDGIVLMVPEFGSKHEFGDT